MVSGELRTFTYSDTVHESKLVNFKKNYPDVEVRTATFESNDEAAAKIKAGFRTDVIEVCLDEQGPLVDAGMLAPIDMSRLENWDDLDPTFRDAAGVASGETATSRWCRRRPARSASSTTRTSSPTASTPGPTSSTRRTPAAWRWTAATG